MTAQCPAAGAESTTVTVTFTNPAVNRYVTGQTVQVTAKNGADGDTVLRNADGAAQYAGNSVSTTVS
jgi:hypothetical protein